MISALTSQLISKYYALFTEAEAPTDITRRVKLLVSLSSLGILTTGLFSILAIIQDNYLLAILDIIGVFALILNMYVMQRVKNYESAIFLGMVITSILFVALYITGGVQKTTFVWYFIYPEIAVFLLGSKRGGFAALLMMLPILTAAIFGDRIIYITDYSPSFEIRFIGAYGLVTYLVYLFEKTAEENRSKIEIVNLSLEKTVQERTLELSKKNLLLANEVKERTKAEQITAQALNDRGILLQEVHHRTKNNMSMIMSMLDLHKNSAIPENMDDVFDTIHNRINSMFIVHNHLYQSDNLATVDFGEYVKKLTRGIQDSFKIDARSVNLNIECDQLELSLEQAIPVGLVLNEIITNSFKYACKPEVSLSQNIKLKRSSDKLVSIDISDNGNGLPTDFDYKKSRSLGIRMIHMLIEDQLGGQVMIDSINGTHYHLEFPYISA